MLPPDKQLRYNNYLAGTILLKRADAKITYACHMANAAPTGNLITRKDKDKQRNLRTLSYRICSGNWCTNYNANGKKAYLLNNSSGLIGMSKISKSPRKMCYCASSKLPFPNLTSNNARHAVSNQLFAFYDSLVIIPGTSWDGPDYKWADFPLWHSFLRPGNIMFVCRCPKAFMH